jgi:methionyl aminopeptidase
VVRDLVGHGIGKRLHEEPSVPNFGRPGRGERLRAGMTICIEPMVNEGGWEVTTDSDGWTMRTADGKLSAHFEHTVAITAEGPILLTAGEEPL